MFKGRKVLDPVVHGATGGTTSGTSKYVADRDLTRAWNNIGKAKSELRKIEHRLGDVDYRPLHHLNETGETNITEYPVAMDQTYKTEFPSGAVVDKYGRSAYMRSKAHGGGTEGGRKISKTGDNVPEEEDAGGFAVNQREVHNHRSDQRAEREKKSSTDHTNRGLTASPKRVEFHERLDMREVNLDGTYTDLAVGAVNNVGGRSGSPSLSQGNSTDSVALRETDIRFLNEHQENDTRRNVRTPFSALNSNVVQNGASKLTHVNVMVPATTRSSSSSVANNVPKSLATGSTHLSSAVANPIQSGDYQNHRVPPDLDRRWEVGSTDSGQSDDRPFSRRFKASIKDIDSDGLAKLKEKIRKQQEKSSSPVQKEPRNVMEPPVGGTADIESAPRHTLHLDHEPIGSRPYNLPPPDGASSKQPKVRKVAAGPPPPTYKGFSETEVKYKLLEAKPIKTHDIRKKEKRKRAGFKLQERKQELFDEPRDERAVEKSKKMTRVIASSSKKPAKQEAQKKEIITTSSWRAGQELVLRELGPAKIRRTSQTSQGSDLPPEKIPNHTDDAEEADLPDFKPNNEHASSTAAELERARALSEEARRVLSDLNYGSEEDDGKKKREDSSRRVRKSAVKRKAPKSTEGEKQQPIAKQRHYDAEEVRRYILQQKRSRLRQQREEEQKQKEADEIRRKQLEELYMKQKQSAATSSSQNKRVKDEGRKGRQCADETFVHPASLADLPRHHPFHENRQRMVVSSESEKGNRGIQRSDEEEMSDGSSTITGDSMEDTTETATSRVEAQKTEVKLQPGVNNRKEEPQQNSVGNRNNIRNVGGFTFNVEGVMSKFSQALHDKVEETNKPSSTNSGYGGSSNDGHRAAMEGAIELPRSRADRIQAIKATAATLQNRIKAEARKITGQDVEGGATSEPTNLNYRWALPIGTGQETDAFVSRYERMIGADTNYSVFGSNLPGTQRAGSRDHGDHDDSRIEPEAAAIRIQAAYRGHTVRQSLDWKLPSGRTVLASHRANQEEEDESSITETSTFSDITITEDSENESMSSSPHKIGTGLRSKDFHGGGKRSRPSEDFHIPRPQSQKPGTKYSWEDPVSDPYSVLNVFARQKRNQAKQRQTPVGEESRASKSRATPAVEEEVKKEAASSQKTVPKPSARIGSSDIMTRNQGAGHHTDSSYPVTTGVRTTNFASITESMKKNNVPQTNTASVSFQLSVEKSDEDTLEEDSYVKTADSEEDHKPKLYKFEKRPSKPQPKVSSVKSGRKEGSSSARKEGSESDMSADLEYPSYSLHRPLSYEADDETALKALPRYSPNTLERQFHTELNQLESMEESMRQLTNMERTRAVSMAQQETVSLAQMLKARQQEHSKEMSVLELKAQREMLDATKELNDARQRAMEVTQTAADAITRLRSTDAQPKTARITSESRSRSEASRPLLEVDNIRPRKSKVNMSAARTDRQPESARTSYAMDSQSATQARTRGSKTESIQTVTSGRKGDADSDSSIRSVTGAEGQDESRTESIGEDISQASGDEYSVNFDETMTEDEMEEKSFKAILPSEGHRKRAKKHVSDNMSITSDEGSVASVPATPRMTLDDLSSFFTGEESFNKFTEEMVRQFMREEELRAQHQSALLRLREKALTEKTKAELAWLDQQRQNLRNKGADDNYPQIIKRQRGLKMRLQEQQAEIKRLKEANKAASLERQKLLQQHEEISRMRQNTQKTKEKLKGRGRLGRPSEVHTEDEVSAFDAESAGGRQKKDYKSDSEIYTEPKVSHRKTTEDSAALDKLKKIHFDERFLTAREQKLLDRRKKAEELLRWKKRLDEEETKVFKMEEKAIKLWEAPENRRTSKTPGKENQVDRNKKTAMSKDVKESQTASTVQESTITSGSVVTAKDESARRSITETPKTEIRSRSESSPEERLNDRAGNSGSESSIAEEVVSVSSVDEGSPTTPRARKSRSSAADDTIINESQYNNDSFEETSVQGTSSKQSGKSPRSPLDRLSQKGGLAWLSGRGLQGNRSPFSRYRSSESESEESISHTESYTETQSDFSDYEGRVRALNEELKRRKVEADRLKKERKKRKKEILKNKEVTLKKQIEAYDNQIVQLKAELQKEMEHEPVKASVRPQIKQPKVSSPKARLQQDVTPTKKGSTSPLSEDSKEGTDSAQSSPSIAEDQKLPSPSSKSVPPTKTASLEKISEASESTITRSRSDTTRRSLNKPFSNEDVSVRTEISEDINENIDMDDSVSEKSQSGVLQIAKEVHPLQNLKSATSQNDDYEVSYTEDFTEDQPSASAQLPHSARSQTDHTEPKQRTFTDNISEHISEMVSIQSEDSQFIRPLDLQGENRQDTGDDRFQDQRSPRSSYSTTKTDSRPSSEKSEEHSLSSRNFDNSSEESESEISTLPPRQDEVRLSDKLTGFGESEDEDETPIASPREEAATTEMDIMGDFNIGDRVQVTGPRGARSPGTLLFKGKVKFAPGIWAGVELESPEGRNDGAHEDIRYFTCRPGHGVLVPGDDLMPAPRSPRRSVSYESVASSHDEESITTDDQEDTDLSKAISEAEKNVLEFDVSPRSDYSRPQKEALTDTITDQILAKVVKDDLSAINRIQDQKGAPVMPKPANKPEIVTSRNDSLYMNGNIDSDNERDINQNEKQTRISDNLTKHLLNDAIHDMITIRKKQRGQQEPMQPSEDLISFDDEAGPMGLPQKQEVRSMWGQGHLDEQEEKPEITRPGSPLPGSSPHGNATKENLKQLTSDLDDLFHTPDEYFEDIPSPTMNKPPPPYPGTQTEIMQDGGNIEYRPMPEELFFAVPHERHEIEEVVSNAVEVFWNQRRYGESMEGLEPPESYYSTEDNNNDVDSQSRRVFEKLLFDSTGDIIRDIYKDEEEEGFAAWQKTKRKRQKYYRGANPPTTIDVLKPIVQNAVIEILGLNGSRKTDKNRWSVRKKKDHVDNILVEELREEEPDWVNYDDDETAVKMQLTEAIFETLLNDTVQTMNKIYRKKQILRQQQH